ncbi:MAG: hypothetical protein Q9227_000587 [Pyrenula ochraceoflavens]
MAVSHVGRVGSSAPRNGQYVKDASGLARRAMATDQPTSRPELMHSLVAIGALHESIEKSLSNLVSTEAAKPYGSSLDQAETYRRFALQQYNKSIRLLTNAQKTIPVEVVLISCLLFLCLENFQHNSVVAIEHLQAGLNILEEWRRTKGTKLRHQFSESDEIIEDYLAPVFARIDLQVDTFIEEYNRRTLIIPANMPSQDREPPVPARFLNMRQVRDCLEVTFRYHLQLLGLDSISTPRQPLCKDTISRLCNTMADIYRRIGTLVDNLPRKDPDMMRALAYLKIFYYIDKIMLQTGSNFSEMALDNHTDDFRQIVHWCQEYVSRGTAELSPIRFSFRLDLGIVHICTGVATRCRDPTIRRQAIRLLRASRRREGLWDSFMAANVAERIVTIEEQGLGVVSSCHDVPKSNRIQIVRIKYGINRSNVVSHNSGPDDDASSQIRLEWMTYPYIDGVTPRKTEWVPMNPPHTAAQSGLDPCPKPTFGASICGHSFTKSKGWPPIYGVSHIKALLAATGAASGP